MIANTYMTSIAENLVEIGRLQRAWTAMPVGVFCRLDALPTAENLRETVTGSCTVLKFAND